MPEVMRSADPVIAPVRRETFSNQIVTKLRDAIISGKLEGGSQITENNLAAQFNVSRGPLREAMSQLSNEGLIVTVPFTGTYVMKLSTRDIRELYSLRTALETLAFKEIWDQRDDAFFTELETRHEHLMATLKLRDQVVSSGAEVHFHSLVYEFCGHKLLLESWRRIAGRLQLYLAVHQRAHGRSGPIENAHENYLRVACGESLKAMLQEIDDHMQRGIHQLQSYLDQSQPD